MRSRAPLPGLCQRATSLGLLTLLALLPLQSALACLIPTPDLAARIVADQFYRAVHGGFAPTDPVVTQMLALCETCWHVRYKDGDSVFVRVPKRIHSMPYGEVVRFSSVTRSSPGIPRSSQVTFEQAAAENITRGLFDDLGTDTPTLELTSVVLHPASSTGREGGEWVVTGRPTATRGGSTDEFVRVSLDASTGQAFAVENHLNSSLPGSKSCLIGQTAMWVFSVAALIGIAVMLVRRRRMGRKITSPPAAA